MPNQDAGLPQPHQDLVRKIAKDIWVYSQDGIQYRIYHGGTNSTRPRDASQTVFVDTSSLESVLKIDAERNIVIVEPNVSMSDLVDATLPYGLLPPVVPEFPAITVGGAYAGTAGESSSWRYGFFDRSVNWVEMVLPTGQIVRTSPSQYTDLFFGAAGSMGTLGVATCFEVQLDRIQRYVEVSYLPTRSARESIDLIRRCTEDPVDFIDGILFAQDRGVVITARTTDKQIHPIQRFSHAYHPWFYLHASAICDTTLADTTSTPAHTTETVPIRDYLFRYDRGAFWMGTHAFPLVHLPYFPGIHTPFNAITRTFLNPLLHTAGLYGALHASNYSQRFIIQDLILPAGKAADFCAWTHERLGVYPLWLCPIRAEGNRALMHAPATPSDDLLCNVGVWGSARDGYRESSADGERWLADNQALEAKVAALGGKKWLYAQVFADTEEDFWERQGCERTAYEAIREKYGAQDGMGVWEKIKRRDKGYGSTSKLAGMLAGLRMADWRWGPPDP